MHWDHFKRVGEVSVSGLQRAVFGATVVFALAGASQAMAVTTPIDLNDFFADPTVTVAPDGSSAVIAEDPGFFSVLLANDPGLGDPNVIIAGPGILLVFEYDFEESLTNVDEFGAFVLDSSGFSAGPAFEFFTEVESGATVSFDLSSLTGEPFIGLQFELNSIFGDSGVDSMVTIRNVRLESPDTPPDDPSGVIPEPLTGALGLLGLSAVGMAASRRRRGA